MLKNVKKTRLTLPLMAVLALTILSAHSVWASGEGWMTDFDAAKKVAAKEKKDILVDFSGSDWCSWCIKLDKEVFSHDEFYKEASQNYILVVLDFPHKPENKAKIPEALQKRNKELQKEFGITGFPTVYLTNSKGVPYAKTGYKEGGPKPYLKSLVTFREKKVQKDKFMAMANAEGVKGLEKAKLLHKALELTDEALLEKLHAKEIAEILKLDSKNEAGIKNIYLMRQRMSDAQKAMGKKKTKEAIEIFESAINELKPKGKSLQEALYMKSMAHYGLKDKEEARKCLIEAQKAAPNTERAEMISGILKKYFSEEKKEDK